MKQKILKTISLLLAAINILAIVCGCGKKTVSTAAKGELNRLKWIEMLSDSFYIQDSKTEKPYFTDISKENALFGKIQQCVDLGIISAEKKFNPNASVSFKEAALNCISAIGKSTVSDYLKTEKELSEKELLKFAKEKILTGISNEKNLTQSDAEKALQNSANLILNKPLFEKEKIKLAKGVIDLRNSKIEYTAAAADLPDVKNIKKGSVIILPPSSEYPAGLARKVVAISGNTAELGETKINEVFDEFRVSKTTELQSSDFTAADGVTIEEYAPIEDLNRTEDCNLTPMVLNQNNEASYTALGSGPKAAFNVNLNLTKGRLSVDEKWGSLQGTYSGAKSPESADAFKFDGKNLYTEKYNAGYEIKGKISLSDITLNNDVDYKKIAGVKVGVNRCETKVNFKASFSFSIKGKLDEDIDILTANIPIGTTGLSVKCVFMLSVGANGEITVKSEIKNTTSYIFEKGLKQVNNTDVKNKATLTGNLTAKVGPKAVIAVLGLDFFDFQALIGMGAKAKISAEQGSTEIPCVDVQAYAPIVTLKFAGDKKTLLNALGFSAEWKVYDIENGWKKSSVVSTYHWEARNGWVDKCTHPIDEVNSQENNNSNQSNNTASNASKTEVAGNNTNSSDVPNDNLPSVLSLSQDDKNTIVEFHNIGLSPEELTYIVYQNPTTKYEIKNIKVASITVDGTNAEFRQATCNGEFNSEHHEDYWSGYGNFDSYNSILDYYEINSSKATNTFTLKCPNSIRMKRDCVRNNEMCFDWSCAATVVIKLEIIVAGYSGKLPYTYSINDWTLCSGYGGQLISFESYK